MPIGILVNKVAKSFMRLSLNCVTIVTCNKTVSKRDSHFLPSFQLLHNLRRSNLRKRSLKKRRFKVSSQGSEDHFKSNLSDKGNVYQK